MDRNGDRNGKENQSANHIARYGRLHVSICVQTGKAMELLSQDPVISLTLKDACLKTAPDIAPLRRVFRTAIAAVEARTWGQR